MISEPNLDELSAFACRLADAARGETLARWQGAGAARNKAQVGYDPVTEADVAAEAAMRAMIQEAYPRHGIAGEEFAEQAAAGPYCWSLDPIDGTRSFVCGLPTWVTLIALLRDGEPVLGVIDAPRLDERYLGDGRKARMLPGNAMLATSGCARLGEARLSTTDPGLLEQAQGAAFARLRGLCPVVRYGHDGYAYARLAAGSLDLVVEAGLQPYDLMALVPVVRGAGGTIGNWRGGADLTGGDVVAAATPELFAETLAVLNA
ncbi:MAG TPA: inositol monophosphatase family protein [Sphingomonadaceae bacterium]|jgi:myo-inositol-1(or 4)-monophosphatase|nr:inositol monophosphatase family protein [Sphingomonadaceae bacterium]